MTEDKRLDLADFDTVAGAQAGYELELRDPTTNRPSGRFVTVLGADSEPYRARMREIQRRRSAAMAKTRRFVVSPEEMEEDAIELLVCATTGWRGLKFAGGADVPFSAEQARALYRAYPAIRDQVEEAIGDRANFLGRSASA